MLVSIVIPMFNAERYIEECIESALKQTYKNIEIIIVNDGSTDKSLQTITKYENKIKIVNKKNGGTASALNAGIKAMEGDWFKWLSADDVLNDNAIEILINETEKLKEKGKSCIFYSNFDYIDESSNIIGEYIEPNNNNLKSFDQKILLLDHFYGNGSTSLIHKSVFKNCGFFDEEIKYQDDYEFWLRCCLLFNIQLYLIPKKLVKYRIHKNQLTETISLEKQTEQNNKTRKLILKKMSTPERKKYESGLKNYRRKIFLRSPKKIIRYLILKILPESFAMKVIEKYRQIPYLKQNSSV